MKKTLIVYLLSVLIFTTLSSMSLFFFYDFFPLDYSVINYIISVLNIFVWAGIWIAIFIWYLNNLEEQKRRIFELLSQKISEVKELKYLIESDEKYSDIHLRITSYEINFDDDSVDISVLQENQDFQLINRYELNKISYLLSDIYLQFDMFSDKLDANMKNILRFELESIWNIDFFILVYIYLYWKRSGDISIRKNKLDYSKSKWLKQVCEYFKTTIFN